MRTRWLLEIWNKRTRQKQEAEERRDLFAKAEAFEQMVNTLGWKYVLDFLETKDDEALAALSTVNKDDPWACQSAIIRRDEALAVLNQLQEHVIGTIQQKNKLLEEENEEKETWQTTV